jgi:hypothetical protein
MNETNSTSATRSLVVRLVAFAAWCLFLVRALYVFRPGGSNVDFDADSAVTVLMAVDKAPVTIFNVYYYGQDRFGAWPFLIARLLGSSTGFQWSPESLFVLQGSWVFSGSLVLAALSKRNAWLIAASYVFALCLNTGAHFMPFRINQPYGWQATVLLLTWLGLRGVFESFAEGAATTSRGRAGKLCLTFGGAALAVWNSTTSAAFLLALLALEVVRARFTRSPAQTGRRLLVPGLFGFVAVVGSLILERLQKAAYVRYGTSHYGEDYTTRDVTLDWGHIGVNIRRASHTLANGSWWPLYWVPAVALAAFAAAFVYARTRRERELEQRLRGVLADDTAIVVIGSYLVAVGNLAIVVLVSHVRYNDYDERYLSPTNLFAAVAGLLTLFLVAKFFVRGASALRRAELGFLALLALGLTFAFPSRGADEGYLQHRHTALALAHKAPDGFLMGMYWDTYLFSALQASHALTPVPFDGIKNRMPWTIDWLRKADSVIVAFARDADRADSPPVTLHEYGSLLELETPRFYEDPEYVFARYRNVAPRRDAPRAKAVP